MQPARHTARDRRNSFQNLEKLLSRDGAGLHLSEPSAAPIFAADSVTRPSVSALEDCVDSSLQIANILLLTLLTS